MEIESFSDVNFFDRWKSFYFGDRGAVSSSSVLMEMKGHKVHDQGEIMVIYDF